MYKFIAQLLISATVGAAVAAGTDADVRGYIGEALREPGAYIQESVSAVATTVSHFSSNVEDSEASAAEVNVTVNENGAAINDQTESNTDVSAQSGSEVQVDSTLNVQNLFPEILGLDAGAAIDTQIQTDASLESAAENLDLSLWQRLGLSLCFDIEDKE